MDAEKVRCELDDETIEVDAGTSVASAVLSRKSRAFRRSVDGEARSALCGMGVCFECRLQVDGRPHQRSCQLPVREGMRVETMSDAAFSASATDEAAEILRETKINRAVDVAVVGAGPAGIAAAVSAGEAGRSVALIDDNPAGGGQIWRPSRGGHADEARPWIERLEALPRLERLRLSPVIDARAPTPGEPARLTAWTPRGIASIEASTLVLATGARELFLPFPGWTLPGVVGAGGLQALIKSGLDVAGKRVVIAGTGPLLLAVAALVREAGGHVELVAEQAPATKVRRFAARLLLHPSKLPQALSLARRLLGVPMRRDLWPLAALGGEGLEAVRLSDGRTIECDLLACGFGLLPESGVARFLAADTETDGAIRVDERQETSCVGVFAAGECTGVGGAPAALVEGRVAGLSAAGKSLDAGLLRARDAHRRFARALARAFEPRAELRRLPEPETIVCRCEDVRWRRLAHYAPGETRRAKLETRCGMGPCQGRICGGALSFLLGFGDDSIRPPFFPTPLAALMSDPEDDRDDP